MKVQLPMRVRWAARIAQFCCTATTSPRARARRRRESSVWLRLILATVICLLDIFALVSGPSVAQELAAIFVCIVPLAVVVAGAGHSRRVEGLGWALLLLVSVYFLD
jgi:hypothetical protein